MAELAAAAGVPRQQLRLEERATTTAESARLCAALLAREGVDRVLLVTDEFHQRRSRMLFRRVGLQPQSSSPPGGMRGPLRERLRLRAREWIGLVWYGLTFWRYQARR